ncbi:exopolyphosphatase [Clostridium amazonitimonense]|uniref:exopolyphosphatase n=1 Tax=Clostridium amazonitimonense TaxID=1499689 RepID=UPI000509D2D1|nr:exopolyphosphatase [Clostridium amazonitimonense]
MEKLGIIDIGSNSVRLVLSQINESGSFHIIDEIKETIRLGEDVEISGKLSEDKIHKTIKTLDSFKNICEALKVEKIIIVATEAVRTANNKESFLNEVKEKVNVDIRVLSGEEEADYDCMAVINSIYTKNSLMMDIGGSSIELAWIKDNIVKERLSLPFGAVNLTRRFGVEDVVTPQNDDDLKRFLKNEFEKISWLFQTKFDNLIGIGGSIRNIGKIDRKRKKYPLDIAHNYTMDSSAVHDIYHLVKSKSLKQRMKIEGLSSERADIFVAAVSSLNVIIDLLKIDNMVVSGKGLREGVLYEHIKNNYNPKEDILESSIEGVLESHYINRDHAYNVYRLTDKLFDDLKSLHHLDDSFKNILKTGAILHDCGISIRYYNHHKHSFYILMNSHINGLTHKELVMSAYASAYHRNNDFDISICQFSGIINQLDVLNIKRMGVLLRIAEGLDRTMLKSVTNINTVIEKDSVTLKLTSSRDIDLEINEALKATDKFNQIYNKKLFIVKE